MFFKLNLCTPRALIGSFSVSHIHTPADGGYIGIGLNHAPFVTRLRPGILGFNTEKKERKDYYVSGGLVQVANNVADVLVEDAESFSEIDRDRAEAAEKRALERLHRRDLTEPVDIDRALAALERARSRIWFIEKLKERKI
ncbi:MAG: ATP synthase F1 subunit epsilon [Deltaproteobacteria bacterium]|nr:ATP synthase F1 subunit epsilon [Deltaproteobacteria bacterium]